MTNFAADHLTEAHDSREASLHVRCDALRDNVVRLRGCAGDLAREAGFGETRCADVVLAVGEACANAVLHAYPDGEPGEVELLGRVEGDEVHITVVDHGSGLRPRRDSPGAGLGLALLAGLATDLDLHPGADGGTVVEMAFAAVR